MKAIFLDHASTTAVDPRVIAALLPFLHERGGNASSPHAQGRLARKAVEEAREIIAASLGAKPVEIIFTSGASESNNQVIASLRLWAKESSKRHIISSSIEHHSLLEPLHQLAREGFQVSFIKPDSNGIVSVDSIKEAITPQTLLVCLQHANNEIGTLQPVAQVGALCRQMGIKFLVDATQTVGHIPVNADAIGCDFLSFSAHKFYGPQGVGGLYARAGNKVVSLILGGDQEQGRRAGTLNVAGIVGMGEALRLAQEELSNAIARERFLRDKVIDEVLNNIEGVRLNGSKIERLPNNAHFSFEGIDGEELVSVLDMAGICVSMGSACTWGRLEPSHVLRAIGLSDGLSLGSLRVTVGRLTNELDIDYFLEQLKLKVKQLRSSHKG